MYELDEALSQLFMDTILDYSAYCHAIKLAKERGMNDDDCKPLINAKSVTKQKMEDNNYKVLKKLPKNENVVRIQDNWYGVRYLNDKGEALLKNDPLIEKDIYMIKLGDGRTRDLTRADVDQLMPIMVDEQALEDRKEKIHFRACELLFETVGIEIIPNNDGASLVVSAHAMERWGQRKLGLTKLQSVEYKRNNYQQLQNDIIAGFQSADQIWVDEEGYQYLFDEENILYIFKDNIIVTLYEKDYGFTKDINRMITFEQCKVLGESWKHYNAIFEGYENQINLLEDKDSALAAQLRSLQSQVDFINSQRKVLLDQKAQEMSQLTAAYDIYQAEFAKLFKKWESKDIA